MKPQLCFGEKKCSLFVIFCFAELASNHSYFFAKKYAVISASKIPLSLRFDKWVWASCFLTTDTWCALLLSPVFQTQHLLHVLPVVLKTANNKNVYITFLMNNQMDWELTKHKEMSCTAAKANKPTHFVRLFVVKAISNRIFWLKNCWRFERAQRVYLCQTLSFRKKCPYFVLAEDRRNFLRVQQSNIFESPSLFSPFTSSVQYWGIRHSYCFPLYIKYIKNTFIWVVWTESKRQTVYFTEIGNSKKLDKIAYIQLTCHTYNWSLLTFIWTQSFKVE